MGIVFTLPSGTRLSDAQSQSVRAELRALALMVQEIVGVEKTPEYGILPRNFPRTELGLLSITLDNRYIAEISPVMNINIVHARRLADILGIKESEIVSTLYLEPSPVPPSIEGAIT